MKTTFCLSCFAVVLVCVQTSCKAQEAAKPPFETYQRAVGKCLATIQLELVALSEREKQLDGVALAQVHDDKIEAPKFANQQYFCYYKHYTRKKSTVKVPKAAIEVQSPPATGLGSVRYAVQQGGICLEAGIFYRRANSLPNKVYPPVKGTISENGKEAFRPYYILETFAGDDELHNEVAAIFDRNFDQLVADPLSFLSEEEKKVK